MCIASTKSNLKGLSLNKDCFNITAMTGTDAVNLRTLISRDQEAVILYIVSNYQLSEISQELLSAQNTGTFRYGFIGMNSAGRELQMTSKMSNLWRIIKNGWKTTWKTW